ncbi:hypothetical protein QYM36_013489 [Artemia franciscana]|uniref:Uncharacterized protein n=1 Tax=Artemia franciscana TaxID=6661 RepID=A0AA88HQ89_ARTSF|nr:hypothetical protein QYM36_013489 [Artemia franciscana]
MVLPLKLYESAVGPICLKSVDRCGAISVIGVKGILNTSPAARERGENLQVTAEIGELARQGKRELLLREINRYNWDVVGLSETHLPVTGDEKLDDNTLILSGRTGEKQENGVGVLLSRKARRSLITAAPISERLIMIRLKGSPGNLQLQLQCLVDSVPKRYSVCHRGRQHNYR